MNINSGINQYNAHMSSGINASVSSTQSLTGTTLSQLQEGQIFEGTVNTIEGSRVTLGLVNGQTILARLDSSILLQEGQSVFFQVKSNENSLIQLKPVSVNDLNTNPTLLKALESAGLAPGERSIAMVNSMMNESMPIDTESLGSMNRLLLSNPDIEPSTLVQLVKYDFPVTIENANMFNAYATDTTSINNSFETVAEGLSKILASADISVDQSISFNNSINNLINDNDTAQEANSSWQIENRVVDDLHIASQDSVTDPSIERLTNGNVPEAFLLKDIDGQSNFVASVEGKVLNFPQENATLVSNILTEKQATSFSEVLSNLENFNKYVPDLFNDDGSLNLSVNSKELFQAITDFLNANQTIDKDTLNELFKSSGYKKILTSLLLDNISLSPEKLKEEGSVSKLYTKVLEQTEHISKMLQSINNSATDDVKNQLQIIKDNVHFMESANEMYSFIQVPLKMFNQHSAGSLYVRQNKKSSYEAGEEITAFLHFDMDHLGETDVYIRMQNSSVNCDWNLSDERAMKLIDDNMDILTKRLLKKGFFLTSQVNCSDKKLSFTKDFLQAKSVDESNCGIMHRYSFDMRA